MQADEKFQVRVAIRFDGTFRVEPYGYGRWVGSQHTTLDGALAAVKALLEEANGLDGTNPRRS